MRTAALLVTCFVLGTGAACARAEASASLVAHAANEIELRLYDASDVPDEIAHELFSAHGARRIAPGTWMLVMDAETHDSLRDALRQVRALRQERVSVEVSLRRVPRAEATIRVGQSLDAQTQRIAPLRTAQAAGAYGDALALTSMETVSYLANTTPVVGAHSAGVDPTIKEARTGVHAEVRIVRPQDGRPATAVIAGGYSVSRVSDGPRVHNSVSETPDTLAAVIERAHVSHRTIASRVAVASDAPVVFAVFDDPEHADANLVASVRVRTID